MQINLFIVNIAVKLGETVKAENQNYATCPEPLLCFAINLRDAGSFNLRDAGSFLQIIMLTNDYVISYPHTPQG